MGDPVIELMLYAVGVTLIGLAIPVEGLPGAALRLVGMVFVRAGYRAYRRGGAS